MSTPTANEMFHAAQALIREGQPVFPCKTGLEGDPERAKAPLTKNGFLDATLDVPTVRGWFKKYGAAAIGIPTGVRWDVLDVDTKGEYDGRVHLPSLTLLGLLNGCQRVARTPSGGWHLYFKASPGLTNKAKAALGLDLRAKGGYVIAPSSYIVTPDYAGYYEEVDAPVGYDDSPLLWDAIVSAIAPRNTANNKEIELLPSVRRNSIASLREWVSILKSGERNNGLHWAVCRCIESGIDPQELMEPALLTGLGEEEINLTISSALKRAGLSADELPSEVEAMFPSL